MTQTAKPYVNHQAAWRLIITPPFPGALNMAVDEAILESIQDGTSGATLRLYAWNPPTLSLGYSQPTADVDLNKLHALGCQLVRRPTGGRAILHTDEITYSVIAPDDEPRVAGGVLESYRRLSEALLAGLNALQVNAQAQEKRKTAPGTVRAEQNPVCFEVPSDWEITFDDKKLIGSAQHRRRGGVLQHGSIPLCGDISRITQVLHYPDEAARQNAARAVRDRATTLENALGHTIDWQTAADALIQGFRNVLNLTFINSALTPQEQARADELVAEKYLSDSWTKRL